MVPEERVPLRLELTADSSQQDFDEVFCALLPRLYRRAALLAGDGAADVVHETYLKLSARRGRFTRHPVPYAYAIRVLVNTVRDDLRRHRRLVLVDRVPDRADSSFPLDLRDSASQVRWLLGHLTAKQAAAVILVDLDDYTIDEAADILGVHRGTASRARARALAALRNLAKDSMR